MESSWVKVQTFAEHVDLEHYEVSTLGLRPLEAQPHHDQANEQGRGVQSEYEPVHQ